MVEGILVAAVGTALAVPIMAVCVIAYKAVFPQESIPERQVKHFFERAEDELEHIRESGLSRRYLLKHWRELTVVQRTNLPANLPATVDLDDLRSDDSRDGEPVRFDAYVSEVEPGGLRHADFVTQIVELNDDDAGSIAHCEVTLPRKNRLEEGDLVTAVGVVVARGEDSDGENQGKRATYLACSAAHTGNKRDAQREARQLMNAVAADKKFWEEGVRKSEPSHAPLADDWPNLRPDKPHPWNPAGAVPAKIDEVVRDDSHDGRRLRIIGSVTQAENASKGSFTLQQYSLRTDSRREIWCRSTRVPGELVQEYDVVEVVGLVIARGSISRNRGGFDNIAFLACPSLQVLVPAARSRPRGRRG